MDKITAERIAEMHPILIDELTAGINEANKKLTGRAQVRIVQGFRDFDYQNKLFAQRPKVTNAKGGQSYHNYGLAFDFALLIDGKEISWDTKKDYDQDNIADWLEVVNVFVPLGWTWGKAFNDLPHLEKTFNTNWREYLRRYNSKEFYDGTKYVRI